MTAFSALALRLLLADSGHSVDPILRKFRSHHAARHELSNAGLWYA